MARRTQKAKGKVSGSSGRFGPRYGRFVRKRVSDMEKVSKAAHRCPRCDMMTIRREGTGIWDAGNAASNLPEEPTSRRPRSYGLHSGRSSGRWEKRCEPAWLARTSAHDASTRWKLTSMSAARTVVTGSSSRSVALRSKS